MRILLQIAAVTAALAATAAHAQIINPDKLVAPPPANPAHHRNKDTQLEAQWLWQYTRPAPGGDKLGLLRDPRFQPLLKAALTAPQSMWGTNAPLSDVAFQFLQDPGASVPNTEVGSVTANANRYITITGCSLPPVLDGILACSERAILFVDLGKRDPLVVFAALRWNEQSRGASEQGAPYTLWIFPSQRLDATSLPVEVEHALTSFATTVGKSYMVTANLLIDPDGTPHKLDPSLNGAITNTKEATR